MTASARPSQRRDGAFALVLGLAVLALAGSALDDALGGERSLAARLAAAPASPALWLERAEAERDPRALRMSLLTGPREEQLRPRRRALAAALGPALDADTRALLR
jgi:hypothetical protein